MDYAYYILLAIPVFLITMVVEYFIGLKHGKTLYTFNDSITNLMIGIGNQVVGLFFKLFIVYLYSIVHDKFSFFRLEGFILPFLLGTILFDFIFYWAHRWGHEINLFWGAHIVHHQSEQYNLSVALRQSWFHNFLSFWMFVPIAVLGVDPVVFMAVSAFSILYQYWIHTKLIGKLGPLEWILNTPSAHRVHHATNEHYLDKNYGAILIIWDRFFGTYQEEDVQPNYGITKPFLSWNPLWANVHFYKELWESIRSKRLSIFQYLFFKGPSDLTGLDNLHGNKDLRFAFSNIYTKRYVFVNFAIAMIGLVLFMIYFDDLTWKYRIVFGLSIVWTIWSCGKFMEKNTTIRYFEFPRILIVLASLNLIYYFQFHIWWPIFFPISLVAGIFLMIWLMVRWDKTLSL
jgi:alkylglycerol monooxygenase